MRNIGLRASLSLLVVSLVSAQGNAGTTPHPQAPLPSVDEVMERYVQAVGGKAAIERITTRILKGSVVAPGGTAPMEIHEKSPNKFLRTIDSPVSGLSKNGFNGAVAWSQNPQRGVREMSGPPVELFKREYDLHRELRLREFYPQMTVASREKVGEREAYLVEAVSADGSTERMYFDSVTGLLLRWDINIGGTTIEAYLEDYREVDGVMLPFAVRRSRPDFTWTDKFTEIKHNLPIDDALFEKPSAP